MEDIFAKMLEQLPSAAMMLYVWIASNRSHSRERELWRSEISSINIVLSEVTKQVNQLTFIIENYVINNGKTGDRK